MSPRLTLAETCAEFRKAGISITNATLADGIASGQYPFGRQLPSKGNRRSFEIWRKDVLAFLNSLTQTNAPSPLPAPLAPAPILSKSLQVQKWATLCSTPNRKDCSPCPYRGAESCSARLMADAASVIMDMSLVIVGCTEGVAV